MGPLFLPSPGIGFVFISAMDSTIYTKRRSSVLHSVLRKPFSEMGMKYASSKEEDYTACLRIMLDDVTPAMDEEIR